MRPLGLLTALFLDVETGGYDPRRSALLRVGWLSFCRGEVRETGSLRVRPRVGLLIEPEAAAVNGWRGEEDGDLGEAEAVSRLAEAARSLAALARPGDPRPRLAGHNVWFDVGFVRAAAERAGAPDPLLPLAGRGGTLRLLDTAGACGLEEAAGLLPEGPSLDALCRQLRIPRSAGAHQDPLADCVDTLAVLLGLWSRRFPEGP